MKKGCVNFGSLRSVRELKALDNYLSERSYISGHRLSSDDRLVLDRLRSSSSFSSADEYHHVKRWLRHVEALLLDGQAEVQSPCQQKQQYDNLCQKLFGGGGGGGSGDPKARACMSS